MKINLEGYTLEKIKENCRELHERREKKAIEKLLKQSINEEQQMWEQMVLP